MRFFSAFFLLFAVLARPALAEDGVARGRYLAVLGDCAGCHTHSHGPQYAGGLPFNTQFGTIYSTNITPDKQTGLGNWTADQFFRALHEGIAADERHLYPAFPYLYFRRISRQDSDDLFAYLRTLKPARRPPTPNRLIFPFNIRAGLIFWNWLYLPKAEEVADSGQSPAWKRGEYLVNGLGHCGACHTPKNFLFGDKTDQALSGGLLDHWYAANLTSNPHEGLGRWDKDALVEFLATGRNRFATAAGNMQEKVTLSTSRMTQGDLAAIAAYLKSLPSKGGPAPAMPDAGPMASGKVVFVESCQACHQPAIKDYMGKDQPGAGLPDYPQLAGDTLILGRDPSTVLRILLEGAQSPVTHGRSGFSMPSFGTLSDAQIADVATYIRNSWGNRAPAVSAGQVRSLRTALAKDEQTR